MVRENPTVGDTFKQRRSKINMAPKLDTLLDRHIKDRKDFRVRMLV